MKRVGGVRGGISQLSVFYGIAEVVHNHVGGVHPVYPLHMVCWYRW